MSASFAAARCGIPRVASLSTPPAFSGAGSGRLSRLTRAAWAAAPRRAPAVQRRWLTGPVGSDRLAIPRVAEVIGAPMWLGQPLDGTHLAPVALRDAELVPLLRQLGWRVNDTGDVDMDALPRELLPDIQEGQLYCHNSASVGAGCERLYQAAKKSAEAEQFTIVLGGDHSIGAASVAAALSVNPDIGIIWVDAHADLNEPTQSPSGNMHGMPVALLTRLVDPAAIPGFEWMADTPPLKPEQIVYVALRDIDAYERRVIPALGIAAYTMEQVDKFGIGSVMEHALGRLEGRPLYLSYDVDAVDPSVCPSTGTRVQGGLNYREAIYVCEAIARSHDLVGMDLVEVNPSIGSEDDVKKTVDMAIRLVRSAMGHDILPDPFVNWGLRHSSELTPGTPGKSE